MADPKNNELLLDTFDYPLPPECIAQAPLAQRDASRLLVVDRSNGHWQDRLIVDLPELLKSGDLLVFNDTQVIPARLRALRNGSGGKVEIFLLPMTLQELETQCARSDERTRQRVLLRSGGKLQPGETFSMIEDRRIQAVLLDRCGTAGDIVEFDLPFDALYAFAQAHGEIPLPPYIKREPGPSMPVDKERYQTIYARNPGAVAAPTAGLHFTEKLLSSLKAKGVNYAYLTLHVGMGTFRTVKTEKVADHRMDAEPYSVSIETANAVTAAKRSGRRIIAVGSTSLRTLESAWDPYTQTIRNGPGLTRLYVYPPYTFNVCDGLLTNFHLPKSSLTMLVAAFARPGETGGMDLIKSAYAHAIEKNYRFFSYGDACLFI